MFVQKNSNQFTIAQSSAQNEGTVVNFVPQHKKLTL